MTRYRNISTLGDPPQLANEDAFRDAFLALLANPEFLAEGGTLAFGLRNVYPIKDKDLRHVCSALKGSDAVVYRRVRALGYEPALYVLYEADSISSSFVVNVVSTRTRICIRYILRCCLRNR